MLYLRTHQSENAHHGGTSIVEFNRALLELLFLRERVPAPVEGTIAKVTDKLIATVGVALHDKEFEETDEKADARKAFLGNSRFGGNGGDTGRIIRKLVAGINVHANTGDELTDNGQHANVAVLDFDTLETTVKLFRRRPIQIPKTTPRLDAPFGFERVQRRSADRRLGLLSTS